MERKVKMCQEIMGKSAIANAVSSTMLGNGNFWVKLTGGFGWGGWKVKEYSLVSNKWGKQVMELETCIDNKKE